MKKTAKIFAALSCVILGTSLVSCSKSSGTKKSKTKDSIELTVWESLDGPDEFIKQAALKYQENHPNISIKFVNVELGDAAGTIALDGPADVGPDLFAAPHDKLGELVNGGHVLATKNPEQVKEKVIPSCAQALTYKGTMYGYPVSAETYALFYNKDLISEDKVPKTWEELKTWASDFNAKNKEKRGFMMDVGSSYYTIIFTTSNGNRLFGADGGDTSKTYINTEDSIRGMEFFQSLRSILDVPAADLTTGTVDGAFQKGNSALHITGLWNVKNFENAGLNFGVAPIPSLPGDETPAASFSGTRAMYVSAYSYHPEEASDFAQFLLTDEMQKLRFDLTGAMPSTNIEVDSPYIKGFLTQLSYSFPMPSIPEMATFWSAMDSASRNIWNGANVKSELNACDKSILGK